MNKGIAKMNLHDLIKKQTELTQELREVTKRINQYPRIGDLIKHKIEGTEFEILTKTQWHAIEFYKDWAYYEVKKEKTKEL